MGLRIHPTHQSKLRRTINNSAVTDKFVLQTKHNSLPHPTRYTTPTYVGSATALDKRPAIKSKADLLEMYPDCFDETVGCFEQFKYHINVDPNAKPVIHAARRVPLELKARLEVELKDLS